MIRALVIILLLSRVNLEMQLVHHHVNISRKSRSNSDPIKTSFVNNQSEDDPGIFENFQEINSNYDNQKIGQELNERYNVFPEKNIDVISTKASSESLREPDIYTESPQYSIDRALSKAEADYNLSKIKSDIMYERLKSLMHYQPPANMIQDYLNVGYNVDNAFQIDDDDIKTNSRSSYESLPFYYHSPYEYESMKTDSEIQKAKDKRYAVDTRVIPVHEDIEDYITHPGPTLTTMKTDLDYSTHNPIYGDIPFISVVLNDYFDKNTEGDALVFKGIGEWGTDFDQSSPFGEEYDNKYILYGESTSKDEIQYANNQPFHKNSKRGGELVTDNGYVKNHEVDKHESGNEQKSHKHSEYGDNNNKHTEFKDFVDTFANKFGNENNQKDSKYYLKKYQDRGEKRKGFHRVYHKDEYQEDKEFYDNTKNLAKTEERGNNSTHNGGSDAYLKSHGEAAIGDDSNYFNRYGDTDTKSNKNIYKNREKNKASDLNFNQYKMDK